MHVVTARLYPWLHVGTERMYAWMEVGTEQNARVHGAAALHAQPLLPRKQKCIGGGAACTATAGARTSAAAACTVSMLGTHTSSPTSARVTAPKKSTTRIELSGRRSPTVR